VFDDEAPLFGLTLLPSIIHVLEELLPDFGFNSFPSHLQVFEDDAPDFGLISLPSNSHVLDEDAPDFGFNSLPSHTQLPGNEILLPMSSPFQIIAIIKNYCKPYFMVRRDSGPEEFRLFYVIIAHDLDSTPSCLRSVPTNESELYNRAKEKTGHSPSSSSNSRAS